MFQGWNEQVVPNFETHSAVSLCLPSDVACAVNCRTIGVVLHLQSASETENEIDIWDGNWNTY